MPPAGPATLPTAAATRANPAPWPVSASTNSPRATDSSSRHCPAKPIVVGHSFGGLIAQKLLAGGQASAAVVSPAPIRGASKLPWAQIRSALPVLSRPGNKKRAVALTRRQFRYGFGNALDSEESGRLFDSYAIPGPGRPVFELTAAKKDPSSPTAVDTTTGDRGPLLIIGAGKDHTVPEVVSRQAYGLYANSLATTDYHVFPDRGHAFAFDGRSRDVADYALAWLRQHVPTTNETSHSSIGQDQPSP